MTKTEEALKMIAEAEATIKRAKALLSKGEHKTVQLELFTMEAAEKAFNAPSGAFQKEDRKPHKPKPPKSAQPRTKKEKLAALAAQPQHNGLIKLEHARFALGIGHLHDNSRLRAMIDAGVLVPFLTVGGKVIGVTVASVRKAINKGL